MIEFTASQKIIEDIVLESANTTTIALNQSVGFVLAQDIVASENSPSLPTAAMDGYALANDDLSLGKLSITGINPAGNDIQMKLERTKCIKTFTGSIMPQGADTLIPIENVDVQDNYIIINSLVPKGFSVRNIGENYAKGDLLISSNEKIDFPQIAIMAELNISEVLVYNKPKVGILATGSELLDLGQEQILPSQIRSSNHLTVETIAKKYGATTINYGCIKDDKTTITNSILKALLSCDIVVTTGGVSVGDYDFVKDVVREIGFEVLFQGVSIKPGQHIILAQKGSQFILALPGFAYSATVTSLLYLAPLIAKLNFTTYLPRYIKATLKEPYVKKSNKTEFIACNYSYQNGKYSIDLKGKKVGTSAITTNLLGNSGLMMIPEQSSSLQIGDEVLLFLWD